MADELTKPETVEIPPFEKLKYYTDLYKFYCELPFKISAAYITASTLILAVAAYFTRDIKVIGWVAAFIVSIGAVIGARLFLIDGRYLERYKPEIEKLLTEMGLSIGPNFHIVRFILRLSVVLLIGGPLFLSLVLYFYLPR